MSRVVMRKVFPEDGRIWRVEWFGGLHKNASVQSEYAIDVALAPLIGEPPPVGLSRAQALNRNRDEIVVRRIGVGALPDTCVGSLWQDGLRLPPPPYEEFKSVLSFDPGDVRLINAGRPEAEGRWIIPANRYRLPDRMLGTACVAVRVGDDPYGLVIPCVEVLRAWLLRSTAMALRLFSGPLHQVRDKIYDPRESRVLDKGRVFVQLRNGMSLRDAWPAALLAHIPYAAQRAREMFDHVMKEGYEGRPRWVRMVPPVTGRGLIKARGIALSGNQKRFLVFDLIGVPVPANITQIVVNLDNDNRGRPAGDDRAAWTSRPSSIREPIDGDVLEHNVEPHVTGGVTVERYEAPEFVSDAKVERAAPVNAQGSSCPPLQSDEAPTNRKHSTGAGASSDTGSHPLRVKSTGAGQSKEDPLAVGLENAGAIMGHLNALPMTSCKPVPAGERTVSHPAGLCSLFPSQDAALNDLSWSFVNGMARRALVLEIQHEALLAYVFEFERRPAKPNRQGERFRLALVSGDIFSKVSKEQLNSMLRTCAGRDGVWPDGIRGHKLRTFIHTKTPADFALSFVNQLRNWATKPPLLRDPVADMYRVA